MINYQFLYFTSFSLIKFLSIGNKITIKQSLVKLGCHLQDLIVQKKRFAYCGGYVPPTGEIHVFTDCRIVRNSRLGNSRQSREMG